MRLPNFNDEPEFQKLLADMGAEIIPIALTPKTQTEIPYKTLIALTTVGLNTSLQNIQFNNEGHLTYKGINIIAYHPIKNLFQLFKYFINSSFHITTCQYLKTEMKANPQNNYFIYAGYTKISSMAVCSECLATINWKNYNQLNNVDKNKIVTNFNIAEFLESTQCTS